MSTDPTNPWEKGYTTETTNKTEVKPWEKDYSGEEKKKDSSKGTSPGGKSGSVPADGSSDIKPNDLQFDAFNGKTPTQAILDTSAKVNKEYDLAVKAREKQLTTSFHEATKLSKEDDDEVALRLENERTKSGLMNRLKDVGTFLGGYINDVAIKPVNTALTMFGKTTQEDIENNKGIIPLLADSNKTSFESEIREVKIQAKKNREKLTDDEIKSRAEQLFVQKEKYNIYVDKANSYLDNLSQEDKKILELDRYDDIKSLNTASKQKLQIQSALKSSFGDKAAEYNEIKAQVEDLHKNNQQVPQDVLERGIALENELKGISIAAEKNYESLLKDKSDLGTAEQEFDLFKRENRDWANIGKTIGVGFGDLGVGMLDAYMWFGNIVGSATGSNKQEGWQESMDQALANNAGLRDTLNKQREKLRKPVESIESAEGFVNYATDLVASQVPILVATSTGTRGLAVIGASSTGQKYAEMNDEVKSGKASYTPWQMFAVPALYGGAEVISEIPTYSILKKGGRVLSAVESTAPELFKKTAKDKAIEWAKDYGIDMTKEMAGEEFTQFVQNFNDKYLLGKKDVGLLDGTGKVFRDTFALTSILKVAPHVAGAVVRPFQSKEELGDLDENSKKILQFTKMLSVDGISEKEKTVIEGQIKKLATSSSSIMAKTIDKMGNMPEELYEEVTALNKKAGEIKAQAQEIDLDGKLPNKKDLISALETEYKEVYDKRQGILSGATTVVDVLPLAEQDKLKRQALEDLVTELNPDGKKDITIDNQQILERANQIYAESKENEKSVSTEPTPAVKDTNTEPTPVPNEDVQPTEETKPEEIAPEEPVEVLDKNNDVIGNDNYRKSENQLNGRSREITIADGSKIKGTYKVVSADDIVASHNEENFTKSNNYPVNERGETINDRDYERDKNSQSEVVKIAQDYDGRAIQQTPVVTKDGIVVDGNNRVMSRKLAAKKNTDAKYKESLINEADMYGVNPDEISKIKNPILIFEAADAMDYNTETLAKFNKQDKKEKSSSGKAVEFSKTLNDRSKRQIAEVYDLAERPSDVTSDPKLVKQLRDILVNNNIIQSNEIPRFFDVDKGVMTKEGVSLMENIALGSVFTEQTINTLSLPGMGDIRNKILQSLVGLINNSAIEPEFRLGAELSNAIEVIYQLKNTKQTIEEYLDQPDIFGEKLTPNVDEYAVILALSDPGFKKWLQNYNNNVGQPDIFKEDDGGITTKRDKTNETIIEKRSEIPGNLRSDAGLDAREDGGKNGEPDSSKNNPKQKSQEEGVNDVVVDEFDNEQNRKRDLTQERVTYEKVQPKNPPKKLSQIIKEVANGLKSHVIYSRSKRSNSLGSYNPRTTLVRITKAGDIDTVAHELGHFLDDKFNLLGTIPDLDKVAILKQLKWYSDRGGSNPPSGLAAAQKAEYLEREGLAEFIRSYIANPTQTVILAPELLSHFDKTIDAKIKDILHQFSNDYLDFANASNIEKTLANVEDLKLPNKNKFIEWLKGFRQGDDKLSFTKMDKFYAEMANSNHFGIKAFKTLLNIQDKTDLKSHENFEIMSRLFYGINGKLENIFSSGMINSQNERLKAEGGVFSKNKKGRTVYEDGTPMNVEWLINGLDNTSEASLHKDMNDVIAMAVAERTIEYAKKFSRTDNLTGIGAGIDSDLSVAINAMNEFKELKNTDKAKYDRIVEAVKRYRQMSDSVLQYAMDKGRISKEQYAQIKESNEYYVALNRNKEVEPGEDVFNSFYTGTNGIGAAKEIIHKAKGGTSTIENPYLSLLKNINNIVKEADRNEVMISFTDPLISTRKMGEGEPLDLSKIGFIANDGDTETIKVYREGKLEKWKFQPEIYKSLKNIESIASNPILNLLAKPSDLIRWTVTHNPVFYARNIVKDTQARLVVSNNHSTLRDMIHNSGDKELFELFGGSQAGHLHTSKESYLKTMKESISEITKKGGIIINPLNFGSKYNKFLQTGENLNRIAEFNSSYKKAKKQGMSDYDAGLYAAFEARDLMDFAVAGHTMRDINKIIVFSNAGVQSIRKASKSLQRDPAGFAYRTAIYSVLPTLAFAALRSAMGDDDEYENLPDNQRDMFYNFKTNATGDAWISIPKPYELGLYSALVDRAASNLNGKPNALNGFTGTMMKTLMPFDESSFLGGLKPIIETQMNRDTYTKRAIVPEWESGKLLKLRKGTTKASLIGQKISQGFEAGGMSVDPRNIDHILKGYGTYFANQGMAITDLEKKERAELNFWASKTGFAKEVPTYNAKSVKKATDLAVELGKINSKEMKQLRNDIEAFSLEHDLKNRKNLLNKIYSSSKIISHNYELMKKQITKKPLN